MSADTNSAEVVEMVNDENLPTAESAIGKVADIKATDDDGTPTVEEMKPLLKFKVHQGRQAHALEMPVDATVLELKTKLQELTGIPPSLQKIVNAGAQLKDDTQSLQTAKIKNNAKLLLIGSTVEEVSNASKVPTKAEIASASTASSAKKEPLCKQKEHLKEIEKGVPDDATPGISNLQEALPSSLIPGLRTKRGQVVRLSFKLELDQLWFATNERTSKWNMSTIEDIVDEPIEQHPGYHMMGLRLGPTEQSRVWIYWVPAQYVTAIRKAILNY